MIKKTLPLVDSVIVCDDGSSDLTSKEAKDAGAFVIRHSRNKGKGAALKSLFDYAKHSNADIVVTLDGDGQFLPEEIPKLTKDIENGKSDIVIGYRFETEKDMPSHRKLGNKILDSVTKRLQILTCEILKVVLERTRNKQLKKLILVVMDLLQILKY